MKNGSTLLKMKSRYTFYILLRESANLAKLTFKTYPQRQITLYHIKKSPYMPMIPLWSADCTRTRYMYNVLLNYLDCPACFWFACVNAYFVLTVHFMYTWVSINFKTLNDSNRTKMLHFVFWYMALHLCNLWSYWYFRVSRLTSSRLISV